MRLHAGQLSLLETDDAREDETIERPKQRAARQRATLPDKPAESATRRGGRATTQRHLISAPAADNAALLTTSEAADLLHVHPRTVQRLVERGQLCVVHLGGAVRFDPHDVAGLIARFKCGAAPSDPARALGSALHAVAPSTSFRDRIGSDG
jgi:excisionase family DNA binding protein